MPDTYVAHVKQTATGDWANPHELSDHLLSTAALAHDMALDIGSQWAELAGRWHDLGKYRKKFQDYIRLQSGYEKENAHIENGTRAPHSTAGAIHAINTLPTGLGHILAYLIAGHHAGLPDFFNGKGSLQYRLVEGQSEYQQALEANIPETILTGDIGLPPDCARHPEHIATWMRMLFSCLVDADFLDTERYMQPEKTSERAQSLSLETLSQRFEEKMTSLRSASEASDLNKIRNEIYRSCLDAARWQPGLFSLTVPTGGGKTLSSLAFALEHAKLFNKRRIIYAIPFTSIIEQNSEVFRCFLGDDAVLEHHSNLEVSLEKENLRNRLATENWDAPLIVTTNVQLFESLHAYRTSRCRKLHNLINSVIILDEAQQLPRDFHAPITKIMQQMADHYGVTWVLCTATQPVLTEQKDTFGRHLLKGLNNVREIIKSPMQLALQLKRVDVHLPDAAPSGKTSWEQLSHNLMEHDSVLAIVNTRNQARQLTELIADQQNCLHLSANMCAEHRSEVIKEIKKRLNDRREGSHCPLRVVSTQLIEAGVDVDFPVVYRAMAGLDSIAQSAGRCNREGRLPGLGQVYVFQPETPAPPGFLRQGEDVTLELLASGRLSDPLSTHSFKLYFELFNSKGERDKHGITELLTAKQSQDIPLAIQFREAAEKFRLIDNAGEAVVVPFIPFGESASPVEAWLAMLERDPSQKWIYRKLQRYTITLSEFQIAKYRDSGCIDQRAGLNVLLDCFYHQRWGAQCPDLPLPAGECVF
ncbi:CRISPR-associated helicase Cas3' [Halioxenophilus sp. WMMB6]|uniref:CRISPR-associated helicase Cas3' n=1 Tax=Halioxenophilus sp. WMMB6 TaxID=3073815 RepID=UPI00295ED175|nr:CRISPR-associated helicase Cas3' [Halioxenophilus sp. WMMB6]